MEDCCTDEGVVGLVESDSDGGWIVEGVSGRGVVTLVVSASMSAF